MASHNFVNVVKGLLCPPGVFIDFINPHECRLMIGNELGGFGLGQGASQSSSLLSKHFEINKL